MAKQVEILKQIQADAIVFFAKLHNLHWNVKGLDFHPIHAATEAIYDEYAEIFDDVAERVLQLDGVPFVTLADMLKAAKIKEESKTNFDSKFVLKTIKADYEYFLKSFEGLKEASDKASDSVTAAYADEQIAKLQKSLWMIKAQLA